MELNERFIECIARSMGFMTQLIKSRVRGIPPISPRIRFMIHRMKSIVWNIQSIEARMGLIIHLVKSSVWIERFTIHSTQTNASSYSAHDLDRSANHGAGESRPLLSIAQRQQDGKNEPVLGPAGVRLHLDQRVQISLSRVGRVESEQARLRPAPRKLDRLRCESSNGGSMPRKSQFKEEQTIGALKRPGDSIFHRRMRSSSPSSLFIRKQR